MNVRAERGAVKLLLMILLASIAFSTTGLSAQQSSGYFVPGPVAESQVPNVSIVQLIASPERYDGERVRIIGYLHLEFETEAIYLHREDFEQRISVNAVWIDPPANLTPAQKSAINDEYVICTGVFKALKGITVGGFPGQIKDVNRLEPWPMGQTKTKPASSTSK